MSDFFKSLWYLCVSCTSCTSGYFSKCKWFMRMFSWLRKTSPGGKIAMNAGSRLRLWGSYNMAVSSRSYWALWKCVTSYCGLITPTCFSDVQLLPHSLRQCYDFSLNWNITKFPRFFFLALQFAFSKQCAVCDVSWNYCLEWYSQNKKGEMQWWWFCSVAW